MSERTANLIVISSDAEVSPLCRVRLNWLATIGKSRRA
jgi:hypothetical protein